VQTVQAVTVPSKTADKGRMSQRTLERTPRVIYSRALMPSAFILR
jgi:hypothetical protein